MRGHTLVAIAGLILLAGCTVPLLDDSESSVDSYPPGVSEDGAVNETQLLAEHLQAMNESTVRVDHRNGNDSTTFVGGPDRAFSRDSTGIIWSDARRSISNDSWGDAEYTYNYQRNATTRYRGDGPLIVALMLRLSTGHYEHQDTRTVAGQTLHELELVAARGLGTRLGHYTGTILVDERGRIHRLSGTVGESEGNATQYEYAFDWDVEAVPKPTWVEGAPRITANKSADGTTLVVRMEEGSSIPAGETLEFYHNGLEGTLTLSEFLGPGDALYLGYEGTRANGELIVSRHPLESDTLRSLRGDQTSFDGTVTLEDGTVVSIDVDVGWIDYES